MKDFEIILSGEPLRWYISNLVTMDKWVHRLIYPYTNTLLVVEYIQRLAAMGGYVHPNPQIPVYIITAPEITHDKSLKHTDRECNAGVFTTCLYTATQTHSLCHYRGHEESTSRTR